MQKNRTIGEKSGQGADPCFPFDVAELVAEEIIKVTDQQLRKKLLRSSWFVLHNRKVKGTEISQMQYDWTNMFTEGGGGGRDLVTTANEDPECTLSLIAADSLRRL